MNPWIIIAALLAIAGAFFYGEHTGAAGEIAKQKKLDDVIQKVTEAAQTGAATAIAANKPINQTIVQKATREVQTNTVYRDCVNSIEMINSINAALVGPNAIPPTKPAPPAGVFSK